MLYNEHMNYLAIDLGTTACKAAVYSQSGVIDTVGAEYPLLSQGDRAEQRAEDWWRVVCDCVKQLNTKGVAAVCVSGQSISFVPIDKSGNPLCNAISWLDMRAKDEIARIAESFSAEELFKITGKPLSEAYSLPKLMWLKKYSPNIYAKAHKFLFPPDYINYRLTGSLTTDYTVASGSMAFDINSLSWSDELLDKFEIDKNKLPNVQKSGYFCGFLTKNAKNELNLNGDIKLFLGGQDQKLAALGAGIDQKTATVSLGTATAVSTLKPSKDAAVFALNEQDKIYECVLSTSGAAIKWLKNTLNLKSYGQMDDLAKEAGGSNGVVFSPDFTLGAGLQNLSLGVSAGNIIYALYEGIANKINSFLNDDIKRLKVFGGGAASEILCQIIANTCMRRVEVLTTNETAVLGAAIIASENKIKAAEAHKVYD